jgi:putative tricarboxylic transport membrane protein
MQLDSARADRLAAIVLFAIGMASLYGGWAMDRLEVRRIHPASIPGLVPMILGALLAICAALLWLSARQGRPEPASGEGTDSWRDAGVALGLCLVYALVLVGNLPFFWATAIFVAAFVAVFGGTGAVAGRAHMTRFALAAAFGLVSSGVIAVLFRYAFLVRLP